jgi:1,2-diacylglycerol 3-alpha-glucosyltransferase
MLTNLYPPLGTGSAVQSSALARELVRKGHAVVVFTARLDDSLPEYERTADGVEVFRLPCLRLPKMAISMNFSWLSATFSPGNLRRMKAVIMDRGIDVLHIHNHMFDMALSGVWLSRKLGIPAVVTIHTAILHTNRLYNFFLSAIDRYFLGAAVIRRASAVICPDCNVVEYLANRFWRQDGVVIPYGISLPPPPSADAIHALRAKWGLQGKRVILSLGHVHALRNRMDLIRAFAEVVKTHPDARLVIVGSLGYPPTEDLVKELGVEGLVVFTGPQPHELVPAFHGLADFEAVWLYQQDIPSAGVACLEAMYCGKAVIAACSEDTHEPGGLRNGVNFINLPRPTRPEDVQAALRKLLDDPGLCRRIGQEAAAFTQVYFSWTKVTQQHEALYEDLKLAQLENSSRST